MKMKYPATVLFLVSFTALGVYFFFALGDNSKKLSSKLTGTASEIKLYDDDGSGIMIIPRWKSSEEIKIGYLQWKEDHPQRARNIMASSAFGGVNKSFFIFIYRTEME